MKAIKVCFLIFLLAALGVSPARATWYGENVEVGNDIMFMDVRWPWWAESSYYACWNFKTKPNGLGGYGGFTAGIPSLDPDHRPNLDPEIQAAFRPASVWSFWGSNTDGEPCRVVASSEYTYPRQYVNEGASGSLGSPCWPFIKAGQWYTMLLRVWEPLDVENPQYSFVGRWVKDVSTGEWHLYGVMRLPVAASSFFGNAGFLEDLGNGTRSVRSIHRRLGYYRKDGQWRSSNVLSFSEKKKGQLNNNWLVEALPEGDHEYLAIELCGTPALLPQKLKGSPLEFGKQHLISVKQPDQPAFDKLNVTDVEAESNGRQVVVSWTLPKTSSPQFQYKVEVYDNPACTGKPVAVSQERMPSVRMVLVDAVVAKPTVRLTIIDAFDQSHKPIVVKAKVSAVTVAPMSGDQRVPGLVYELLHQDLQRQTNYFRPPCVKLDANKKESHHWLSLAEIGQGKLVRQGISRGFDTSLAEGRGSGYAFRFKGFLRAPADGLYLLRMQGSDGYRISLNGRETLTWDGPHGPEDRFAAVNLAKGDHAIAVEYFVDKAQVPFFKLEWEGPGIVRQEIPATALFHQVAATMPVGVLTGKLGDKGTASLKVTVEAKGCSVVKTRLYLGKMQLAEGEGAGVTYDGPMLAGTNTLWSRIVYNTNCTVDSVTTNLIVTGPGVVDQDGWTMTVAGEAKVGRGLWRTATDGFMFIGEGEYVLSKRVKGDFTLTCRVDSYAGAKGEPVNGSSWVGLTAREHGEKTKNWGREFDVFQMAHKGVRTSPDNTDIGGARFAWSYQLPKGQPWLRMTRQGKVWMAWTSVDGKVWNHGVTHIKQTADEMSAGIVFRALPQDAKAYFSAKVSCVNLEEGLAKDLVMPEPVAATHTDGPRLTGVVMAQSDANIVVLRSSEKGLLRSTDDGKTWTPANGNLGGAANVVRSVAIHPKDPLIMYRAAGRVVGGSWDGGLWKTVDGGKSWNKLDFKGDFDGEGPSALCGEVLAIHNMNPETVYAGCETKGLFRSTDGGATWTKLGAEGERITALDLSRWEFGRNDKAIMHVVTCPDSLMPLLGRGKPQLSASVKTSRDYLSQDGGSSLTRCCEWKDMGFYNVAFDRGNWMETAYATTHGFCQANWEHSKYIFPSTKNVESFRPATALACTGRDDARLGRALFQVLDPVKPGRISRSERICVTWDWIGQTGDVSVGGYIAFRGEFLKGEHWWLLATDGLYRSDDRGKTLKKVMDDQGILSKRVGD